jgi:hypothetical protein
MPLVACPHGTHRDAGGDLLGSRRTPSVLRREQRAGIQHCVVHGGALDVGGDRWVSARATFLER